MWVFVCVSTGVFVSVCEYGRVSMGCLCVSTGV